MKPKCVEVPYQYARDPADITNSTTAILHPYKKETPAPDGFGGHTYVWNSYNSGPAVELRRGIFEARATYAAMLSAAGLEKTWNLESAVGTYLAGLLGCLANAAAGTEDLQECKDEKLDDYMEDYNKLEEAYVDRITKAILTCDNAIDSYIASYAGCNDLDVRIDLWENYWNDLILK